MARIISTDRGSYMELTPREAGKVRRINHAYEVTYVRRMQYPMRKLRHGYCLQLFAEAFDGVRAELCRDRMYYIISQDNRRFARAAGLRVS